MPRIRTIKPEFYRHHDLFLAEKRSGFPIRVAFSGLWCCADVEGRFKWKPTELKLDILPYDEVDFNDVLQCLIDSEFIIKYSVEGKEYGVIPTFKEHQRITGTESKYASKIPEYKESLSKQQGNTLEIHNDSTNSYINTQPIDNHNGNTLEIHNDSIETLWQVGKEDKERNNRKEDKERNYFNSMPNGSEFNGLPATKINASIEIVRIVRQRDIVKKDVEDLWSVFKIQNLTGKKFYADEDAVYSHFINWIKTQNFKEIKPEPVTSVKKESQTDFDKYRKNKRNSNGAV